LNAVERAREYSAGVGVQLPPSAVRDWAPQSCSHRKGILRDDAAGVWSLYSVKALRANIARFNGNGVEVFAMIKVADPIASAAPKYCSNRAGSLNFDYRLP
jgi:hypothetical protein